MTLTCMAVAFGFFPCLCTRLFCNLIVTLKYIMVSPKLCPHTILSLEMILTVSTTPTVSAGGVVTSALRYVVRHTNVSALE